VYEESIRGTGDEDPSERLRIVEEETGVPPRPTIIDKRPVGKRGGEGGVRKKGTKTLHM